MSDLYIDLMTDFGFKRIFGQENTKPLLIHLLNTILQPKTPITALIYINSEQMGQVQNSRKVVFDIHCETANGERFIIEMQKDYQQNFIERTLYYAAMALTGQGEKGRSWKYGIQKVNSVSLLNFVLLKNYDSALQRTIKLTDTVSCKEFTDKLNFYYVEFPKFDKGIEELSSDLDRWLYIFTNLHKLKTRPAALQFGIFKKVLDMAEIAKMSPEEYYAYQLSLKHERDFYNREFTVREEGRIIGLHEGRKEGKQEGREEGRHEGQDEKAQQVAIKLLQAGKLSIEDIADAIEKDVAFVETVKARLNANS